MKKLILQSILVVLIISNYCLSQSNKIEINYSRPPLNSLKADDMWNFTLKNKSNQNLEFYLFGTLTEKKAGLIATGTTVPILLKSGETKKFRVNELSKIPDINYVHPDQRYKEALMRAGNLPTGEYTICVTAKEAGTDEDLGNECLEQEISKETETEITLLAPDNGETIDPSDAMIFSWAVLGAKTAGPYKIKIVEITGDESPENAMLKNKAFFEKEDIRTTTFQYPTSTPKFKEGKKYAWKVFKGNIESSVMLFSVSNPGIQASLNKFECTSNPGEYYFEIKLELTSNSTYNSVTIPQNPIVVSSSNPFATISINYTNSLPQTLTVPFSPTIAITGNFVTTNAITLSQIQFIVTLSLNLPNISIPNPHVLEMNNIPACQTACDSCGNGPIWYFGDKAGLDFRNGTTTVLANSNSMNTKEGTAIVSDNNGTVLFYTDGRTIWNRENNAMPNGEGLNVGYQFGGLGSSSGQPALIVPWPDNCNLYYVFTTDDLESSGQRGYRYSIVDLSLENGRGDVNSTKDEPLFGPSTEKIAAVRNPTTGNYWVIMHGYGTEGNKFYSYEIRTTGLSTTPIISTIGTPHSGHHDLMAGQMKISHDGKRIALAVEGYPPQNRGFIEVYDFNISSGTIGNQRLHLSPPINPTSSYPHPFGIEFSPDCRFLYYTLIGSGSVPNQLYRIDLNNLPLQGMGELIDSQTGFQTLLALQLGPNGVIYISRASYNSTSNKIGTINDPNNPNVSNIDFNEAGIETPISQQIFRQGFPNIVVCPTKTVVSKPCQIRIDAGQDTSTTLGSPVRLNPQMFCQTNTIPIQSYTIETSELMNIQFPTTAGVNYCIKASGTFTWGASSLTEDAAYSNGTGPHGFIFYNDNGVALRPIPNNFNPEHIYNYAIVGNGQDVTIRFSDVDYSDNRGSLLFEIFECGDCNCNYTWSPSTGLSDPSSLSPLFTPTAPGTYSFTLTADCGKDCITSDEVVITVTEQLCNCKDNSWGSIPYSINGVPQTPINCNDPVKIINVSSPTSSISFNPDAAAYSCSPASSPGCISTFNWRINNIPQPSGPTLNLPGFSGTGDYNIEVTPVCGSIKCIPCIIIIKVADEQTCNCGEWALQPSRIGSILNGTPFDNPLNFNGSHEVDPDTYVVIAPRYNCPENCEVSYGYIINDGGIIWRTTSLSMSDVTVPTDVKIYAKCGDKVCDSSTVKIIPKVIPQSSCVCENNIIQNGNFVNGFNNWGLVNHTGGNPSNSYNHFTNAMGCCDNGFVPFWGNRTVGLTLSQQNLNIEQGKRYKITFCGRWRENHSLVRFRFRASNGQFGYTDGTLIGISPDITSSNWATFTIAEWTAPANFNTILINPENNNLQNEGPYTSWGDIDNICITEIEPPTGCDCHSDTYLVLKTLGELSGLKARCGQTMEMRRNTTVSIVPEIICNPDTCLSQWKMDIIELGFTSNLPYSISGSGNTMGYDLLLSSPVGYKIVFTGNCGGKECKCEFTIKTVSSSQGCVTPPSGMVGWWTFDETIGTNAADIAGVNNQGTYVSAPVPTSGMVDGALKFNGTDQYIKIPDHSELDLTENLTIDAWVYIDSFKNHNSIIVWKGGSAQNTTSSYSLFLNYESRKFGFMISNGTTYEFITSSTIAQPSTWYHVTGVADDNNLIIYINGNVVGQITRTISPLSSNNYPLFIGAIENSATQSVSNFFQGIIDEVELFKKALNADEILSIFNAGSFGKCKPQ